MPIEPGKSQTAEPRDWRSRMDELDAAIDSFGQRVTDAEQKRDADGKFGSGGGGGGEKSGGEGGGTVGRHGYNPEAVSKAISGNRAGGKIGKKESSAIHRLLRGRD